ncbi:hypothetical protein Tco_0114355, partial [Tanacetum coccineum]
PKTMQEAIEMATELMDKRINTLAERQTENKRKKDCPQWKNKNQGNGNGVARAYAVGVAGQNPDNNVVTGTFLLNNRCASILFDTGADRSFTPMELSVDERTTWFMESDISEFSERGGSLIILMKQQGWD